MKSSQQMRILAVCETLDYQNFTRRATFDAIAGAGGLDALCHTGLRNAFRTNLRSDHARVFCHYRLLPGRFSDVPLFRLLLSPYRNLWKRFFDRYDVVLLSSPLQAYLLEFCRRKVVYLVSDPYHLMGYRYQDEKVVLDAADLVMATSKNLRDVYLPRYFGHRLDNVFYWPNTVDTALWDHTKFARKASVPDEMVLGFAGNLMRIVDLDLLDHVTERFPWHRFRIAGKVSCQDPAFVKKFQDIIAKPHVTYLGFIPFNDLPDEVSRWDICLMLDDKSELSSYHHHNKLYQYLALGKPVVVHRNHGDYDPLKDVVCLAEDYLQFSAGIEEACLAAGDDAMYRRRLAVAEANSSAVRAREFFDILKRGLRL